MTNEQKQVKDWMKAFGQETPEVPTIPSEEVLLLRAKLELEECLEKIDALGLVIRIAGPEKFSFEDLDWRFERHDRGPSLVEIADSSEDQKVVTEGTLVACGLVTETVKLNKDFPEKGSMYQEDDPLFNEVMRSNWSKMWTNADLAEKFGSPVDHERTVNETGILYTTKKGLTIQEVSVDKWLVKDANGKVIKSPTYSPAALAPIIEEISK